MSEIYAEFLLRNCSFNDWTIIKQRPLVQNRNKILSIIVWPRRAHTGCVRDRDLKRKKYWTPDFLGFFCFVKTIKLLITQKNLDTSTKS